MKKVYTNSELATILTGPKDYVKNKFGKEIHEETDDNLKVKMWYYSQGVQDVLTELLGQPAKVSEETSEQN